MAVSVLMLRALLHACELRGIARSDLLAGASLTDALSTPQQRIDADDFERVCLRALALTGDPALGLTLGTDLPEHVLQIVGYLVRSATSLRAAHRDFARYACLLADTPSWELREHADVASFEFRIPVPQPTTERMANEWAAALAYRTIRAFAPSGSLAPVRVELMHARPAHVQRYADVFACEVRFQRPTNAVVYPRALLDLPQLHGDDVTCGALRTTAEGMLDQRVADTGIRERVLMLLRREPELLRSGIPAVARRLSTSESTLRRMLAQDGVSPSGLLDEVRSQRACSALRERGRSVKSIADALGYADTRSFHRAFKRWTGLTPAAYRNANATERSSSSAPSAPS